MIQSEIRLLRKLDVYILIQLLREIRSIKRMVAPCNYATLAFALSNLRKSKSPNLTDSSIADLI